MVDYYKLLEKFGKKAKWSQKTISRWANYLVGVGRCKDAEAPEKAALILRALMETSSDKEELKRKTKQLDQEFKDSISIMEHLGEGQSPYVEIQAHRILNTHLESLVPHTNPTSESRQITSSSSISEAQLGSYSTASNDQAPMEIDPIIEIWNEIIQSEPLPPSSTVDLEELLELPPGMLDILSYETGLPGNSVNDATTNTPDDDWNSNFQKMLASIRHIPKDEDFSVDLSQGIEWAQIPNVPSESSIMYEHDGETYWFGPGKESELGILYTQGANGALYVHMPDNTLYIHTPDKKIHIYGPNNKLMFMGFLDAVSVSHLFTHEIF